MLFFHQFSAFLQVSIVKVSLPPLNLNSVLCRIDRNFGAPLLVRGVLLMCNFIRFVEGIAKPSVSKSKPRA